MLKLAHRVATMPAGVVDPRRVDKVITRPLIQMAREVRANMTRVTPTCIDIQPVFDYYISDPKDVYDLPDFPCGMMPFPNWFVEYTLRGNQIPSLRNTEGSDRLWCQLGAVGSTLDMKLDTDLVHLYDHPAPDTMEYQYKTQQPAKWAEGVARGRFWTSATVWFTNNLPDTGGRPVFTGVFFGVIADNEGRPIDTVTIFPWTDDEYEPFKAMIESVRTMFLMAASFMSCKNVATVEYRGDGTAAPAGKAARKAGVQESPVKKFYTLEIEPLRRVLNAEGRAADHGIRRAMHICRGHFADYTPDKPLFGSTVGRVWRPQHVRGSAAAGTVTKDYRVNPGGA